MKKNKKLLATAVLSLACGVTVGVFPACFETPQEPEHVHNYTVWQYNDEGHWKKCPDDDAVGETTAHNFNADNECECGYVKAPEVKYGSAHAIVHLVKGTETITDYSDVTVSIDDSNVVVSLDKDTGELTLTQLIAGENYTLNITKPDYVPYSVVISADEEEDVPIGGNEGIVIRYDLVSMVYTVANGAGYEVTLCEGETVIATKTVAEDNTVTFEGLSSKKEYTLSAKMLNKITVSDSVSINTEGAAAVDLGLIPQTIKKTVNNSGADAQYLVDVKDHSEALIEGEAYIAANIKINAESEEAVKGVRVSIYTRFSGESRGESLSVHRQTNDGWMIQQLQTWQNVKLSQDQVNMIANGATVVLHRSANGELTMYFGSDSNNFVLLDKVFNKSAFYSNAIEQWGIVIYKEGNAEVEVSNVRYGATLGEALNVNVPVQVTNQDVENGKVVVSGAKKYDNFVLDIQPENECVLKSITINGNDATSLVKDGKIVLDAYKGETLTIVPVFERTIYGAFENVNVGGRKADTGCVSLGNGTVVTLKNETLGTYTLEVTDGKIAGRIPVGTYTASIADTAYMATQVVVTESGIANAIELPYKFMSISGTAGWGGAELDISHSSDADAYVTINNSSLMCLSVDKYDEVAFTLKVDRSKSTGRQSIWMYFEGDADKTFLKVMCNDGGNNKISWWPGTSGWGNAIAANPTGDIMVYDKTTYDLTMVRNGNKILIFVDGEFATSATLPEDYAAKKCQVGINASGVKNPVDFHYAITSNISAYTGSANISVNEPANGTISVDKTSAAIGEKVTITVTPNANYGVKTLTVNGVEVALNNISAEGKYEITIKNTQSIEVAVEYELAGVVEISSNVMSQRHDLGLTSIADGTKVTLASEEKGTYELEVTEGKIAGQVPQGTYTASVNIANYKTASVVVGENGIESDIVLGYNLMGTEGTAKWGASNHNFAHANDQDAYVTVNDGSCMFLSTAKYDEVAFTLKVNRASSAGRQSIWMHFEGDADMTFLKIMCNDGGNNKISWWPGTTGWGNAIAANPTGDIMVYDKTTYDLTMVRSGRVITIYVDGTLVAKEILPEAYATKKCQVGVNAATVNKPADFHYVLTTDLTNYTVPAVQVTNTSVENGKVEVLSGSNLFDTFVIKATANEGYVIKSISINGVDKTSSLSNGELTLAKYKENTLTIVAEFVSANSVSVNASVKGVRSGSDVTLSDGAIVRLSSATLGEHDFIVKDGAISGDLEIGSYTASIISAPYAGNYATAQVEVTAEGIGSEIVLNYNFNMSKAGTVGWGNTDFGHLAEEEPYLAIVNGNADSLMTLTTNAYETVVYTLKVDKNNSGSGRQGIWMYFEGDTEKTFLKIAYNDGNNGKLIWWSGTSGWGNAISASPTGDIVTPSSTTFDLTVVRVGAVVNVYVDNELVGTANLPESYATKKCKVGVFAAAAANAKFYTEFTTDVSSYKEN